MKKDSGSKIAELVVPIAVNKPEMVYSNKVYLSQSSNFSSDKGYLNLKGYIFSY
jgi:hypothetical protein